MISVMFSDGNDCVTVSRRPPSNSTHLCNAICKVEDVLSLFIEQTVLDRLDYKQIQKILVGSRLFKVGYYNHFAGSGHDLNLIYSRDVFFYRIRTIPNIVLFEEK